MSFASDEVGIEDYAEVTQLLFPHPPIIEKRFMESATDKAVELSFSNTPITVQWGGDQDKVWMHLFVRRMTAANIATLQTLRNMTGLMNVKIELGVVDPILCAFGPDNMQSWNSMIAEHPEGAIVPEVFKVYEAHIAMIRME